MLFLNCASLCCHVCWAPAGAVATKILFVTTFFARCYRWHSQSELGTFSTKNDTINALISVFVKTQKYVRYNKHEKGQNMQNNFFYFSKHTFLFAVIPEIDDVIKQNYYHSLLMFNIFFSVSTNR